MLYGMDILSLLAPPRVTRSLLTSASSLFSAAISLRVVLFFYGLYQDAHGPLKYTDVDYNVFTDAARYVAYGHSPYRRDTYRYTPLLAWILLPTAWEPQWIWFSFGKALFAVSDIVAGWMIFVVLRRRSLDEKRALKYASIWLLNPMVATISTRGSSEGLLCVMVMALLWAAQIRQIALTGVMLGLGVHFKIYPFIYGVSILLSLEMPTSTPSDQAAGRVSPRSSSSSIFHRVSTFLNPDRATLLFTSLAIFSLLNISMYTVYGPSFMQHTYLHHLSRIDHRHNFSPYSTLLYLSSSATTPGSSSSSPVIRQKFESLAFVPQLLLSTLLIPLAISQKSSKSTASASSSLPRTMLAQTFAFVTFNKVCTSQYFLWYLVFLPIYLPGSILTRKPALGLSVLAAWAAAQAVWLWQGYKLEMLGQSTFVPGLWLSSLLFFSVNCWVLGIIVSDSKQDAHVAVSIGEKEDKKKEKADALPAPEKTLRDEGINGIDNDDTSDGDIEEIIRDQTVDEMVREERRRRKVAESDYWQERSVVEEEGGEEEEQTARSRQQKEMALLRAHIADIQGLSS